MRGWVSEWVLFGHIEYEMVMEHSSKEVYIKKFTYEITNSPPLPHLSRQSPVKEVEKPQTAQQCQQPLLAGSEAMKLWPWLPASPIKAEPGRGSGGASKNTEVQETIIKMEAVLGAHKTCSLPPTTFPHNSGVPCKVNQSQRWQQPSQRICSIFQNTATQLHCDPRGTNTAGKKQYYITIYWKTKQKIW